MVTTYIFCYTIEAKRDLFGVDVYEISIECALCIHASTVFVKMSENISLRNSSVSYNKFRILSMNDNERLAKHSTTCLIP